MKNDSELRTNSAFLVMCAPPITNRRYSRLPAGATDGFQGIMKIVGIDFVKEIRVVVIEGTGS